MSDNSAIAPGRAAELDDTIDRGVVAAAGRFGQANVADGGSSAAASPDSRAAAGWFGRQTTTTTSAQAELDSLAQAEIWMAIAEQSKTTGATDIGTSDEADWAIAHSLAMMDRGERADVLVTSASDSDHAAEATTVAEVGVDRGEGGVASAGRAIAGSTLAAIGVPRGVEKSETSSVPSMPSVTRADLDAAIEAGDWAAVGATVALLAAASDLQSFSQESDTSQSRESTAILSVDASPAAELDYLVDAGDWEGVVLMAAAKFEAAEAGTGDSVRSGTKESGSGTGSGTHSPSTSTSVSESPSKAQKRAEIRAEVEALVRRVVPEEIDNVDEMMLVFEGREEELVETLRTMQERAVAQIARAQLQNGGQGFEARPSIDLQEQQGPCPPGSIGSYAGVAAAGCRNDDDLSEPRFASAVGGHHQQGEASLVDENSKGPVSESGFESDEPVTNQKKTALELAIEAGDWEAVGEAAGMMSDSSAESILSSSANVVHQMPAAAPPPPPPTPGGNYYAASSLVWPHHQQNVEVNAGCSSSISRNG